MKNEKTYLPFFIRINGNVVQDFGKISVHTDLLGQRICVDFKHSQQLHHKWTLENDILYYDLMVPEYVSSTMPCDESKAMINLSLTGVIRMMPVKDILMICACKNFICIGQANKEEETSYRGLGDMMNELPPEFFIRINNSMVIAKKYILMSFHTKFSTLIAGDGNTYDISKTYKSAYFDYWDLHLAEQLHIAQEVELVLVEN